MKAKILRVLGVTGFIIAMGSLSACFEESYHPGYGYGRSAYAEPGYYPQYVPTPRYYAYNVPRYRPYDPHPYFATPHRSHEGWQREERQERREREHHNNHDRY
jgi:hypothetical protein